MNRALHFNEMKAIAANPLNHHVKTKHNSKIIAVINSKPHRI